MRLLCLILAILLMAACGTSSEEGNGELPTRFVAPTEVAAEITPEVTDISSEMTPELTPELTEAALAPEQTPEVMVQLEVTMELTPEVEPEVTPDPRPAETLYDVEIGDLVVIEGQLVGPPGDDIDVQLVLVDRIGNTIDILSSGIYIPPPYFEATVALPAVAVLSATGEMSLYAVDLPTILATPDPETLMTPQPQPTGLLQLNRLLLNPVLEDYTLVYFSGNPLAGWSAQLLNPAGDAFVSYAIGTSGSDDWGEVPWLFVEIELQDAIPLDIEQVNVDTDEVLQDYENDLLQMQSLTLSLRSSDEGLIWIIDFADGESITVNAE